MTTKTKKSSNLTLKDRLSRLTYVQACKLLGPDGSQLIQRGGAYDEIDIQGDVYLRGDLFRLKLRSAGPGGQDVVVTITLMASSRQRLLCNCTACNTPCEHIGAALSLILEEKLMLGLAAVPKERIPIESLSEKELLAQALSERVQRAREEKFRLKSADPSRPWTDYTIASAASGKTYRVALRGEEPGMSYCSCPDFRTNTLGTCKHIMYALERARGKFPTKVRNRPFRHKEPCVHVQYNQRMTLHLRLPSKAADEVHKVAGKLADKPVEDVRALVRCVGRLEKLGHTVTIYPDAEELIQKQLFQERIRGRVEEIRRDPAKHPLRKELLKAPLLPYQLDGIAFAVGTGRAVLADDMGLGKTIQGVGIAELLARDAGISRVLVICPASVKSQWRSEIHRFCDRDVQLVIGRA